MIAVAAAPGWYGDPWGQAEWRWWDGQQWTPHTFTTPPDPAQSTEPEAPADSDPGFFRRTAAGIRDRREAARAAEEAQLASERAAIEECRQKLLHHQRPISGTWMQFPTLRPAGWDRDAWEEVVGESHYQEALEAAAQGRCEAGPVQCLVIAQLVAEPENPHDPNAIQVRVDGQCVGYIPRDETYRFHPWLRVFAEELGEVATCRAWLKGGWKRGKALGTFGIELDIRHELEGGVSVFNLDEGFLPNGYSVSVVGEEHCQDYLAPLLSAPSLVATLEVSDGDPFRPKVTGECLVVKVDGTQVGGLTPAMCERHMPLVRAVAAAGMPVTCHAAVERGKKKLEVSLWLQHPDKVLEGSGG